MNDRPSIIFVMSDDHAAHAISAYGSRLNRTPPRPPGRGRAAAGRGVLHQLHLQPSRASILTGTYSHVNGVSSIFTELDYRVPTFVDVLHDDGYQTALFGKWHLGEHGISRSARLRWWRVFLARVITSTR